MQRLPTLARSLVLMWGALSLSVFLLAPLSATAAPEAQVASPVILTLAMSPVHDLDPVYVSRFDPDTHDLIENLFVGLTRFNPLTQQIEPMIAKSWNVSSDGLTWTFELRDDIQWVRFDPSSGTLIAIRPVVAGDFVYAIQRGCDPLRPSPLTTNLMVVDGCQTVATAFPEVITDLFIAREIGARATSPTTLQIDLRFEASYFPVLLSTPEFRALPREAVTASDNWASGETIVTSGPYALQSHTADRILLVRNPHWPGVYEGNIDQIDVRFTDAENAAALVASGQAERTRLAPGMIHRATTMYPDLLRTEEGTSLIVLGFSFEKPLTSTAEIRRALALAIDRQVLANSLGGEYVPSSGFTPQAAVAAPHNDWSAYSPSSAQAALTDAGYPNCDGIPERITLTVRDDDPLWQNVSQAIAGQWNAVLGCNPALFTLNTASRVTLIEISHNNHNPDEITRPHLWLAAWSADYPDANAWLNDALHCRYGYLRVDRACDEADALLDQAAVIEDTATRAELYRQVEERFFGPTGSFPVIPLFISQSGWLQQARLTNVNGVGAGRFDLWTITTPD